MKGKGAVCNGSSFRPNEQAERIEQLIENLIRCIANAQVKTRTNEATLAKSRQKISLLATRCGLLEQAQRELLNKIAQLEQKLETLAARK